jgi:hypothetical protein
MKGFTEDCLMWAFFSEFILACANLGHVYHLMGYSQKARHWFTESERQITQLTQEMPEKFYEDWLVTSAAFLYEMNEKTRSLSFYFHNFHIRIQNHSYMFCKCNFFSYESNLRSLVQKYLDLRLKEQKPKTVQQCTVVGYARSALASIYLHQVHLNIYLWSGFFAMIINLFALLCFCGVGSSK